MSLRRRTSLIPGSGKTSLDNEDLVNARKRLRATSPGGTVLHERSATRSELEQVRSRLRSASPASPASITWERETPSGHTLIWHPQENFIGPAMGLPPVAPRSRGASPIRAISPARPVSRGVSPSRLNTRPPSRAKSPIKVIDEWPVLRDLSPSRLDNRPLTRGTSAIKNKNRNCAKMFDEIPIHRALSPSRLDKRRNISPTRSVDNRISSSRSSSPSVLNDNITLNRGMTRPKSRSVTVIDNIDRVTQGSVVGRSKTVRGVSQTESFLALSRASNASRCAINPSHTGDYGPIARPKSRGLSPSQGFTVYMKPSSRGPSPVRGYDDFEDFPGSRGPSPSRVSEYGVPSRPVTSRPLPRDQSPVYIKSRGASPAPRGARSRDASPAYVRSRGASPVTVQRGSRSRGPSPVTVQRGSRSRGASPVRGVSPLRPRGRSVTRTCKSAVTPVPEPPLPCTPVTLPILKPAVDLPTTHSMVRVAPPVVRSQSRQRGSTAFVVWNEAANLPPPRTPKPESITSKKLAGKKSSSNDNGTDLGLVAAAILNAENTAGGGTVTLPTGVMNSAANVVANGVISSAAAQGDTGPAVTGKIQRKNTELALSVIQSARAGCTLDGNTDIKFDAVDAKHHLEAGLLAQEPKAGESITAQHVTKLEATVAILSAMTPRKHLQETDTKTETQADSQTKTQAEVHTEGQTGTLGAGEVGGVGSVQVVQGVVVGDPETESQSAASEVSAAVTPNKSPSVAERAAQGLGSAASRVRMLASSTGTLSRFRFRSSKKNTEDTNKSVDEKNKKTEEQIKSAESSKKNSAGSRKSSAGSKKSTVVTRKFPMPGALNSAASHVRRLTSGVGLFSNSKFPTNLGNKQAAEEAAKQAKLEAAASIEAEKLAVASLEKAKTALEQAKQLQDKHSEAAARLLDMMSSQRRTQDVTNKIKTLISEEGVTPVAAAKLQGMLVSHQRTAEAAKKLKDFMEAEGLTETETMMKLEDIMECQSKTTEVNEKLEKMLESNQMTLQEAEEILTEVVDTQERATDKAAQLQEMMDSQVEGMKKKVTSLSTAVDVKLTAVKEAQVALQSIAMPTVQEESENVAEAATSGPLQQLESTNNAVLQLSRLQTRRQSMQASATNAASQILSAAESPGIPLEMQQTADKAVSDALRTVDVKTASATVNPNTKKVTETATSSAKVVAGAAKEAEKKKIAGAGNVKDMQPKAGTSVPSTAKAMEQGEMMSEPPGCCGGRSSLARKLAARKWPGCCARCIRVPAPKQPKPVNTGPGCARRLLSKLMCCKKKNPDVEAPMAGSTPKLSFCARFRRALRCGALGACCGALSCTRCSPCCARISCACCCPCCARIPCCRKCCRRGAVGDVNPNPLDEAGRRKSHPGIKGKRPSRSMPGPEVAKLDPSLLDQNSVLQAAIPVLPVPLAWFCLVCNILVPGLGTIVSGAFCLCFGKPRFTIEDRPEGRLTTFCLDLIVGMGQLFTVIFCLVGWGWSIWWGTIMVRLAKKHKRLVARAAEEAAKPPNLRRPSEIDKDKR